MLIKAIDGVRRVPEGLLDVARVLRMSKLTTIWKIGLPAALPTIAVGLGWPCRCRSCSPWSPR